MFYDLNVPWTDNNVELQRTVAFLHELGYDVIALTNHISGKVPNDLKPPIPSPLPFPTPPKLRFLRRCTLSLSDPAQNHRISALNQAYDILALRPTDEKTLQQACTNLDCDLISLDLTIRYPFYLRFTTLAAALNRGIKFEICYAAGVLASDSHARRNLISNATQLIRATRGRGLVISSEARRAAGCRGPWDVVNLAAVWGLSQEKGKEAVSTLARSLVVNAGLKRTSYKGVVDVVYGGEAPSLSAQAKGKGQDGSNKRSNGEMEGMQENRKSEKPLSKREMKRQAKRAKLEAEQTGQPENAAS
ncbi:ribonuclease P complex subunit Pop2 [Rhizodiscina lignyota]|uniref:Ribonuclease P complex subunit Pop2 n=1 Tax=Rhizodiscina lignyota TaxID=1504668 RepID=A0A9P4M6R4_9PEZI|nr:ribonuclease P complex subunit Pop2 [Rhizodiscina lignyota]